MSICDLWNVNLGVYYKLKKKNRVRNKLDFLSSSNLIFTACVACKNQFRNQIDVLIFWTWYFEIKKKSSDTRYFKNQVEIDRGNIWWESYKNSCWKTSRWPRDSSKILQESWKSLLCTIYNCKHGHLLFFDWIFNQNSRRIMLPSAFADRKSRHFL